MGALWGTQSASVTRNLLNTLPVSSGINPYFALDGAGNVYTLAGDGVLHKLDRATGVNGVLTAALSSDYIDALAVDAAGNVYAFGEFNGTVYKVTPAGAVSTFLTGTDGTAPSPVIDPFGNLFFANFSSHTVQEIAAGAGGVPGSGAPVVVAGGGASSFTNGITATQLEVNPSGLAVDGSGNLYIADHDNGMVEELAHGSTTLTLVAGEPGQTPAPATGSNPLATTLLSPIGLAIDSAGDLYILDNTGHQLDEITGGVNLTELTIPQTLGIGVGPDGAVYLGNAPGSALAEYAATPQFGGVAVGQSATVTFTITLTAAQADTIAVSGSGYSLGTVTGCVMDGSTSNSDGAVCTIPVTFAPGAADVGRDLGQVSVAPAGGPLPVPTIIPLVGYGVAAQLQPLAYSNTVLNAALLGAGDMPGSLAASGSTLYAADTTLNEIFSLTSGGAPIGLYAGGGTSYTGPGTGGDGSGPLTGIGFNSITGMAVDLTGRLYVADAASHVVRLLDNSGFLPFTSTYVGTGASGSTGDGGPASGATLEQPTSLAIGPYGNLFILDAGSLSIREVSAYGSIITTVVSGLTAPAGLTIDAEGNLYFFQGSTLYQYSQVTHTLTALAGSGAGFNDGPAASAQFSNPTALAVDAAGDVYIADSGNNRIRLFLPGLDEVTTVAGDGTPATLNQPQGLLLAAGSVLADDANLSLRQLTPAATLPDFGTRAPGSIGPVVASAVINAGNTGTTLSAIQVSPASFTAQTAADSNACAAGVLVEPGAGCNLDLVFSPVVPVSAGPLSGQVTVTDDAVTSPQSFALSGNVGSAPAQLAFNPAPPVSTTLSNLPGLTVQIEDGGNSVIATANDLIQVTITGPGSYSQSSSSQAVAGVAVLNVGTLAPMTASGTYTVAVSDAAAGLTLSQTIVVSHAAQLGFAPAAPAAVFGLTLPAVTVAIQDSGSNTIAEGAGSTDSITLTVGGPGNFTHILTAPAVAGVATFNLGSLALPASGLYGYIASDNTEPLTGAAASTSVTFPPAAVAAPAAAVGAGSSTTVTFNFFNSSTAVASVAVLTQGAAGLDFSEDPGDASNPNACKAATYTAGQSCIVTVDFNPTAPGLRPGAVVLADSGGHGLQTIYVSGIGQAAEATMDVAAPAPVEAFDNSTLHLSSGQMVVDAAGDLLAQTADSYGLEKVPYNPTLHALDPTQATVVYTGSSYIAGTALDGAGNLYVADQSQHVWEVPNENGALNAADKIELPAPPGGWSNDLQHLATDGSGDVYVTDYNLGLFEIAPGGAPVQLAAPTLTGATDVTVDASGNVFVADDNDVLYEIPAGGTVVEILNAGEADDLATDAAGDLLYSNYASVSLLTPQHQLRALDVTYVENMTANAAGTVYFTASGYPSYHFYVLNRQQAPALSFGNQEIHEPSSPLTITVANSGNLPLNLSAYMPSADPAFTVQGPGGAGDCTTNPSLAPAASCVLPVVYEPVATSPADSGSISFNDNTAASPHTITLSGNGISQPVVAMQFAPVPPAIVAQGTNLGSVIVQLDDSLGNITVAGDTLNFVLTNSLGAPVASVSATAAAGVATADFTSFALVNPGGYQLTVTDATNGSVPAIATSIYAQVPASALGSGSGAVYGVVAFNFTGSTAVASVAVVTGGVANLDFTEDAGDASNPNACKPQTYTNGQSCVVQYDFSPTAVGSRAGAVELLDASGNVLQTAYINGVGQGAQASFDPAAGAAVTASALTPLFDNTSTGFDTYLSIAFDGAGDMFIVDNNHNNLVEIPRNGSTYDPAGAVTVAPGKYSCGIALDGAGNLFYNNCGKVITEVPRANATPSYNSANAFTRATLPGSLSINNIAADGAGNLYCATSGGLYELAAGSSVPVRLDAAQITDSDNVVVDAAGDIVVDNFEQGSQIAQTYYRIPASGGPGTAIYTDPFGDSYYPSIDAAGDVLLLYGYDGKILLIPPSGPTRTLATTPDGSGAFETLGADTNGNVYLAFYSYTNYKESFVRLDRSDAPAVNFGSQIANVPATQYFTVGNIGNVNLNFSGFTLANTAGTAFALALPQSGVNCASQPPLAPGASCGFGVVSAPTASGADAGTVTVADNTSAATHTLNLSTNAILGPPVALALATPPAAPALGGNLGVLNIEVLDAGGNVLTANTDAITLTVTGGGQALAPPGSLNAGVTAFDLSSSALTAAGNYTITATDVTDSSIAPLTKVISIAAPALAVGASATSGNGGTLQTATFTFNTAATVASVNVVTSGSTPQFARDASDTGAGACAAGSYSPGQSCTVELDFAPTVAGIITGAVQLRDGSGHAIQTVYVEREADAPLATLDSGHHSVAAEYSGANPAGVAVSQDGTYIYVADPGAHAVYRIIGTSKTSLGSGWQTPNGIAVDGAGNVYVADSGLGQVIEVPVDGSPQAVVRDLSSPGAGPDGVAVDGAGNVYIADTAHGTIWKSPPGCTDAGCQSSVATGLTTTLTAIAADAAGDLYVPAAGGAQIEMLPASGGSPVMLGSAVSGINGIALDAAGDVYVSQSGQPVSELIAAGAEPLLGYATTAGVAVDGLGGVYTGDGADVIQVGRIIAQANFTGAYNTPTAPVTLTLANAGNGSQPLQVSALTFDQAGFQLAPSQAGDCTTATTLNPGQSCALRVIMDETTLGSVSGTLSVADNSLNQGVAYQDGDLEGTVFQAASVLNFTVANQTYAPGLAVTLAATGPAGDTGAISYVVNSGPATVSGSTLTVTGAGTVSVTANQAADTNFTAGALTTSFTVAPAADTVNFAAIANQTYPVTAALTLSATGSAGDTGAITYAVVSGPATVSGNQLIVNGAGAVTVSANQAADANYLAGSANTSFTVAQAADTVNFASIGNQIYPATGPVSLSATGSAGDTGAITYSVVSGPATISGSSLTVTGIGSVTVSANQAADANFLAGSATQSFTVGAGVNTLAIGAIATQTWPVSAPIALSYTSNSTAAVTFSVLSGPGAVSGTSLTVTGAGAIVVQASQTAGVYPAATVSETVVVNKGTDNLAVGAIPNQTLPVSGPIVVNAAGAAGDTGAITLSVTGPATLSGNQLTVTGAGTVTVSAHQAADSNFNAGSASTSFTVSQKQSQTITFAAIPNHLTTDAAFTVSASASSGLAVTLAVLSGPASISGGTVMLTGQSGLVTIQASQPGNGTYAAAAVSRSFVVTAPSAAANTLGLGVASLSFGSQAVGTSSAAQTIVLTATGTSTVSVSAPSATGDFAASTACASLAAGTSCTVSVTFTPTATGTRTGSLVITSSAAGSPQTVTLTGAGIAPGVALSPSSLTFGPVVVGQASAALGVTITNSGNSTLQITGVTPSTGFGVTGGCATVAPGASCSLAATFTPAAAGAATGTLTLSDNAGGGTQVVLLAGTGTAAGVAVTPANAGFAPTVVGSLSPARTVTLTNTGTAALTAISASTQGDFQIANGCGATLAAAASCSISVQYAPQVAGAESGTLLISDSLGTQPVALAGTGLAPGANLSVAALQFGGQLVNAASPAQTVVLTNSGTSALAITTTTVSAGFADTTGCGASLAAGASCGINVSFAPTATGLITGTLSVADAAGTQTVALSGQGTAPGLAITPAFANFGATTVAATSAAQTLTVTNTGTAAVTLGAIAVTGDFSTVTTCSTTAALAPGASCLIGLSFTPSATGLRTGGVSVSSGTLAASAVAVGTGTEPGISATPAALAFGSQAVGVASAAQTVTVTNTGTAALTISAIAATGDFAEADTCTAAPIAAGASCVINVTMTASSAGTRTGTLNIYDGADGQHPVALSGVGTAATVLLTPTQLAFGSQPVPGATIALAGSPQTVVLKNTGNTALAIASIAASGAFTETNTCGASLAAGSSCTASVTFAPTLEGQQTGALVITDNATGSPSQSVALAGVGSPNGLVLAPPVLAFGGAALGVTSAPQTATLTNNTGAAVTSLVISASGELNETDTCGGSLAAGASCTLHVTVTPALPGAITGAISINGISAVAVGGGAHRALRPGDPRPRATNPSHQTLAAVAVSGGGSTAGLSLSPQTVAFAAQAVGSSSAAQTLTLSNTGATALSGLTIGSTPDFPYTTTCGATLAGNTTCTISLTFKPAAAGARTGMLSLAATGGLTASAALSGQATGSTLAATPSALTFAPLAPATASAPQTVTLSASGAAVNLQAIAVAGAGYALGTSTCGTLPAALAGGASCTVQVIYTPAAVGSQAGTLTVTSDASNGAVVVGLSGSGASASGSLTASPASVTFAAQGVNHASAAQTVTLGNATGAAVPVAISITGANAADFSETSTCGASLANGASCAVSVVFTPAAAGARSATLVVAGASGISVPLAGTGSDFSLTAGAVAAITAGQSATVPLTLASLAGDSQTVTLACTVNGVGTSCAAAPASVALAGTTAAHASVVVTTTPPQFGQGSAPALPPAGNGPGGANGLWWLAALALVGVAVWQRRRWKLMLATGALAACVACGGITNQPVSTGTGQATLTVTVTATSSTGVVHTATATVQVNPRP